MSAMSEPEKIDPFWWCRDDARIARMVWDKACQPLALKMLAELDDPATWGLPPDDATSDSSTSTR